MSAPTPLESEAEGLELGVEWATEARGQSAPGNRVGGAALVVVLGTGLGLLLAALLGRAFAWVPHHAGAETWALLGASLGVAGLSRVPALRTSAVLGRLYQLVGALLLSWPWAWVRGSELEAVEGSLSWLAAWILLFPLILPAPPLRTLAFALLAAATPPLLFLGRSLTSGEQLASLGELFAAFHPYLVCAGVAVAPSYFFQRLRQRLQKARAQVRSLGSYRLIRQIGAGGMGEVWYAEHDLLARPAAVKVIHPGSLQLEDPERRERALARFEEEAHTTSSLRCPHTIGLYDFGRTEDGSFYYVMEYLEGRDLETIVSNYGPLDPGRAVFLMHQACLSLGEAHEEGVVHRDVKPANLFVCRLGQQRDFLKVLDFGLAARQRAPGPKRGSKSSGRVASKLTQDGYVVGTPAFMSPEQIRGIELDGRADLYSLALSFYWALSGSMPFEEDDSDATVMQDRLDVDVPPLSMVAPKVPAELAELIMECLERDPNERPATIASVAERLEGLALRGTWDQVQAREWWKQHPAPHEPTASELSTRLLKVYSWSDA